MKFRLFDLLRCSCGKGDLQLKNQDVVRVEFIAPLTKVMCSQYCGLHKSRIKETVITPEDCKECYGKEIKEATICCSCGKEYAVLKGIPRFLPDSMRSDFQEIQKTFSYEWKMFRFGDRNWGQDIEYRKKLFLQGMGVTPDDLKGKMIFDAGCGSGLLSIEMAESFEMEVVALDLAFGIEKAYEHNKNPFLYFLQGSVLEPPLREQAFDYLYCAGVLVALPDTREGFRAIIKTLKQGGRCFIWVYHPIDRQHHPNDFIKMIIYNGIRNNITSRLPVRVQYYLYRSLIPLFLVKQKIEIMTGRKEKKDALIWREKMQALFDMFSPAYQNRHTQEEVIRWYGEEGFADIAVSDIGPYGFGLYGNLKQKDKIS